MERLDVRALRHEKRQRAWHQALRGGVAVAGVTVGLFFVWLAFTLDFDSAMFATTLSVGFVKLLSGVFGLSVATAAVGFAYIKA